MKKNRQFNFLSFRLKVIVSLLALVFLMSSAQTISARSLQKAIPENASIKGFSLHSFADLQILMPDAGAGKNIILPLEKNDNGKTATQQLIKFFGSSSRGRAELSELAPETQYEKDLAAAFPDLRMFVINELLPVAIQKRFNRKLDFGGPNCFYTALSMTDGLDQSETRHVSLNEFKARLALLYTEIPGKTAQPGDVLLFNSSDHGAVFLGGDRVFHKKDLNKEYYFRMPRMLEVFFPDPGEWVPGPNYCGPYSRPHDTKVSKIQIFRRNKTPLATWNESIRNLPEYGIINLMKTSVMKTAPAWSLGKIMGYWSEILSEEMVRTFDSPLKAVNNGQQLMTELESIRDQIFISIEDGYFSSPYAKAKIIKEIWFYDNDYSRELVRITRDHYGLATSEEDMTRILAALKAIDGDPRGKSLLAIIRS
ncbi:MAG: hypothetical protein KKB51_03340 [Candidatus Riflebacteria bacterium]|nr:hypothetical protein [Candidatus Riflebacteria bacterium]